jgi:predicted nuclease with TOPRIM domain
MSPKSEKIPFSIHRMIRQNLSKQNLTVTWLARKINIRPISLHQQLNRSTLQVNRLWSICQALELNIFQEIANRLERENQSQKALEKGMELSQIDAEVDGLKRRIELLENENKTLKEVISLLKD